MTPKEQLAFEEDMGENPELASEVSEMKLVNDTIFYANLSALKDTMQQDLNKPKNQGSTFRSKKIISAALILAGISGIGYYFISENPKETQSVQLVADSLTKEKKPTIEFHSEKETVEEEISKQNKSTNLTPVATTENKPQKNKSIERLTVEEQKDTLEITTTVDKKVKQDTTSTSAQTTTEKAVESIPKPTNAIEKPIVNCSKTFEINASSTCNGKSDGKIAITPNKIGQYVYRINDSENDLNGTFYNLSAGDYTVFIEEQACTYENKISVTEKWCPQNKAFSFNPEFGEKWNILLEEEDKGTFVIYNSTGKEIYKDNFANGNATWNGTDFSGNLVDLGLYFAIIEYADNRIEKVELTIIRK